jgi:CHAP domain-containing protein
MARLLQLTTGPMRGGDVREAQHLLGGANVFGVDFHPGAEDGVFGEQTGSACVRAKAYLGYSTKRCPPSYGDELAGYLTGQRLPLLKRVRKARQQKQPLSLSARALREATKHLGLQEQPANSNRQPFGAWYGYNGVAWCAEFVSYCYSKAGSKAFAPRQHYAYVPYIVNDARAGRNGLSVTTEPRPGDLVCYDWQGNGVADHVGLFEVWVDRKAGHFRACEGNTSPDDRGSQSNGGGVYRRGERPGKGDTRSVRQVQAFVRVSR